MAVKLSGVDYGASPRGMSSGLARPVRWVVLHATDNTASARAEAHYAATRTDDRSRWTSAHFYVDTDEIVGSVPLDMRAWAAYSEANAHGWHIEMCGRSDRVPAATIARTAGLVTRLAELDTVPVRHCGPSMVAALQRGICGHADITEGLHVGSHTDPGDHFDWPAFIAAVEGDDVSAEDVWKATFNSPYDGRDLPAQVFLRYANFRAYKNGEDLAELKTAHKAILAAVTSDQDAEQIMAQIAAEGEKTRTALASIRDAILAALPAGAGPVSRDDLEAALRAVLGSVDGATPGEAGAGA